MKAFLISVIFCETIALATISAHATFHGGGTTSEIISRSLHIECDPNCHSNALDYTDGWWWRSGEKFINDPVAMFTFFLVIATAFLALGRFRTLLHFYRSKRAYVSGRGYFPRVCEEHCPSAAREHRSEYFMLTVNNYCKTPAYVPYRNRILPG
jgi:hypothetical protein